MAVKLVQFKGRQYDVKNLNEETKQFMTLIKASSEQIARAQAEITIAEAGRAAISSKLEELLKDIPSEDASTKEE